MLDLSAIGYELLALDAALKGAEAEAMVWAEKERQAADTRIKWERTKGEIQRKIDTYLERITYACTQRSQNHRATKSPWGSRSYQV